MKQITTFLICIVSSAILYAQTPSFEWANSSGSTSSDVGEAIITDASGNVYVTGTFRNTVDFDPGSGVYNLTSNGNRDAYVQKLDSDGNLLWVISFGSNSIETANDIALDASENVYVAGDFSNTVDFDPGAGTSFKTANSLDGYVLKLDSDGNFLNVNHFALDTTVEVSIQSIAIDTNGNIYAGGYFDEEFDADPSSGVNLLTSNGSYDDFLIKLDNSNTFVWEYICMG